MPNNPPAKVPIRELIIIKGIATIPKTKADATFLMLNVFAIKIYSALTTLPSIPEAIPI